MSAREDSLARGGAKARRARIGIVMLVALLLRVGWVLVADVGPDRRGFHHDMTWYHLTAAQVARGMGLSRYDGTPTAEWPPGYPALLGGIYYLSGDSILAAQLANAVLGALTCLLTYLLGRRLFGGPAGEAVGLVAAALLACLPGDVFYSALILSEVAFGAIFVATALLFVAWEGRGAGAWWRRAAFGSVLGLASLVRGIALGFVAVPVAIWLASAQPLRATLRKSALAALGMALVIAPWTLRNQLLLGAPVLVSTSIGRTLGHAHTEAGGATVAALRRRVAFRKEFAHLPYPEREIALMHGWQRRTRDYVLAHPGEDLQQIPVRFYNLYKHGHQGFLWGREKAGGGRGHAPLFGTGIDRAVALVADVYYFALLGLALLGLSQCFSRRRRVALLLPLTMAYFTFMHSVVFPGNPRYHATLAPFFCISAAAAVVTAQRSLRARRWAPLAGESEA